MTQEDCVLQATFKCLSLTVLLCLLCPTNPKPLIATISAPGHFTTIKPGGHGPVIAQDFEDERELCELCGKVDKQAKGRRGQAIPLLECGKCLRGFHSSCLAPPLSSIPEVRTPDSQDCTPVDLGSCFRPRTSAVSGLLMTKCVSAGLPPPVRGAASGHIAHAG